ncbi:MAG: FecR domain-containing protein, partial [Pseudohongiellaceae bacterium]
MRIKLNKASKEFLDRICFNFLVICLACYSPANFAQQEEYAGRVVTTSGQVIARDVNGQSRTLARGAQVFAGESVITGPRGFAQIRLRDQAIIALKESTEFQIVAFSFQDTAQSDVSTMRLIEGGFRTITGSIGSSDRNAYNIVSEFGIIGIRGTDHEGVIVNSVLFTGVYEGGTTVSNGAGQLDLGLNADFDFAQVDGPNSPPLGLLLQPEVLGNIPVLNVDETSEETADDGNAADNNVADNNASTADSNETPSGAADTSSPPPLGLNNAAGSTALTSVTQATQANAISVDPNQSSGDGTLSCAVNSSSPACRPVSDQTPSPTPAPTPTPTPEPTPAPTPEPTP